MGSAWKGLDWEKEAAGGEGKKVMKATGILAQPGEDACQLSGCRSGLGDQGGRRIRRERSAVETERLAGD